MRMYKSYFSLFVLLLLPVSIIAQDIGKKDVSRDSILNKITDISSKLKEFSTRDTSKGFSIPLTIDTAFMNKIHQENMPPPRDENGLLIFSHEWTPFDMNTMFKDTVIFDPVFLPVVFEGNLLPADLDFRTKDTSYIKPFYLIAPDSTFAPLLKKADKIRNARRLYYMENPQKIKLNALYFKGSPVLKEEVVEKKNPFKELLSADNSVEITGPEIEKIRIKPAVWAVNGLHQLNLSQHSFSDHWPGDNSIKLDSYHRINLNYKKKKVYFNNQFEWRLNLQQMKADTVNKVSIQDDLFRTYSTFGVNAFKNWSYNTNLEMKTPLLNRYNVNDPRETRKKQRAILSPFELNLGIGMRYAKEIKSTKDSYRKLNMSADLSLFSLNYKYVRSDEVNVTWFGITKGYRDKHDFGSTFNFRLIYNRNRYTYYDSRIKYFTNYKRTYVEWENTLNFKLNNYFSTSIYWYVKFDDNVYKEQQRDRWARYFAYYQRLGFGLNYSW